MSRSTIVLTMLAASGGIAVWIALGLGPGCPALYEPKIPASIQELVEHSDVIVEGTEVDRQRNHGEAAGGESGRSMPVGVTGDARGNMDTSTERRRMTGTSVRVDRIMLNDGGLEVGDLIPVRRQGVRYISHRERLLEALWPFERTGPSRLHFLMQEEDGGSYGAFFGDYGRYDTSGLLASADSCTRMATPLIYDDHWTARGFVAQVEDTIAQRSLDR